MTDEERIGRDTHLSRGFDSGNYCNAYETNDFDHAVKMKFLDDRLPEYKAAFILGFFGSYELDEISMTWRDDFDEAYHSEHGQRVLELGYCDSRKEAYAAEQNAG